MAVTRLNDSIVQQLQCPPDKKHWEVFDTLIKGLFVDVFLNERMTYRLRWYDQGVKKMLTLGNARVLTIEEARKAAREKLRQIHIGADPQAVLLPGSGPSVEGFFQLQYLPFVKTYKKSWGSDEAVIRNHIIPALGPRGMGELIPPDIARLVQAMKIKDYAPGTINRVLVLLRYGFTLALRWHITGIEHNPAKELKNLKDDNKIERFLTPAQAATLMACVKKSDNPTLHFVVGFLIYTGARKREALDAKWCDINWLQKSWRIPKTKSGKVRHTPLSKSALALLQELHQSPRPSAHDSDYIFPNTKTGLPYVSIYYSWDSARKQAGLPELRMHDLRHSFASFLVNAGRSLYEVQELLGHSDIRTTSRYAHLSRDRLFEAVESIPAL